MFEVEHDPSADHAHHLANTTVAQYLTVSNIESELIAMRPQASGFPALS